MALNFLAMSVLGKSLISLCQFPHLLDKDNYNYLMFIMKTIIEFKQAKCLDYQMINTTYILFNTLLSGPKSKDECLQYSN